MDGNSRSGYLLLLGIALFATAAAFHTILVDWKIWYVLPGIAGLLLIVVGTFGLRGDIRTLLAQRRGEVALYTVGMIGVIVALCWLSVRFPLRADMSSAGLFSLSQQTVAMLDRLEKPVHIVFFHDPMMRETVEIYKQIVDKSKGKVSLELYDPMLNPAQARMRKVEFAGTAIVESGGRQLRIQGPSETEIANTILRVTQGVQPVLCFLDGHGEPDPFSLESHDHAEGAAGHSHGLGTKEVLHERHGMAKARGALEAFNYKVEKISLAQGKGVALERCSLLLVVGPRTALLASEVDAIRGFLLSGHNAFIMIDPFVQTGLEPLLKEFGIVADDNMVVDEASHFWTDISAPAVTDYNRHEITAELPLTFFPGARAFSPTAERIPGISARPLLNSSKSSFSVVTRDRPDFDPATSQKGPLTMMVVVNRKPEFVESTDAVARRLRGEESTERKDVKKEDVKASRLVVAGDSDFATNSFFHIMGNGKLFLNAVNYLTAQPNLMGIQPRTYDLPRVNLTNQQMKGTLFLSMILIPALLGLVGTVVWWKQR